MRQTLVTAPGAHGAAAADKGGDARAWRAPTGASRAAGSSGSLLRRPGDDNVSEADVDLHKAPEEARRLLHRFRDSGDRACLEPRLAEALAPPEILHVLHGESGHGTG